MSASSVITFPRAPGRSGTAFLFACVACAVVVLSWGDFGRQALFQTALLAAAAAVIVVSAGTDHPDLKPLLQAFFVAYALRLALILLWQAFSGDGLFFIDDVTYDGQAMALATSIPVSELRNAAAYLGTDHVAYPVMLSFLYRWLGHSVLCATLVNAVFGAATAPVAYWAASELTGDRSTSRTAMWIAAFFLYDVGWALFLMRDTILLFFFSLSLAALISLVRRRSFPSLLIAVGSLEILGEFRFYAVHILLASAATAVFLWVCPESARARWTALLGTTATSLAAIAIFLSTVSLDWVRENVAVIGGLLLKADAFQAKDIFQLLIPSLSVAYLRGLAMGTLRYSFQPLGWVFWDIDWIGTVLYPGMYVIYFLLPFFLVGLWIALRELKPIMVLFFAPLLFHALIEIHLYEGGDRQRMMVDMLFAVAAAIGWQHRAEYRKAVRVIYITFVCMVGAHLAWHFARYLL